MANYNKNWTPEKIEMLHRLFVKGLSDLEMARRIPGTGVAGIKKQRTIQGLIRPGKGGKANWSEEDVNYLTTNWGKGNHSATTIALHLGKSRNSVIGKAHRMGLQDLTKKAGYNFVKKRPPPKERKAPHLSAKPLKMVPVPERSEPVILREVNLPQEQRPMAKPLLEAGRDECRFPVSGAETPMLFCCAPVARGSWCHEHARRVFQ
jgi:hypothetical protein